MRIWHGVPHGDPEPVGAAGWARALIKGVPLAIITFGCLALLLLVRLIERPLFGMHRPWTPHITVFVCRTALRIIGIPLRVTGSLMKRHGAVVANHSSWLDIFVLNARARIYFVSKSEVAGWPGIGWLARATGTVFIQRDPRQAAEQKALFEGRLMAGHKLLFFPEGTSTDGRRVLTFKTTLFAAFFAPQIRDGMHIQPVSVIYHAPEGQDAAWYGWWGEMDFGPNLLQMLAAPRHGQVELIYHAPLAVADYADRKSLAVAAGRQVRRGVADRAQGYVEET